MSMDEMIEELTMYYEAAGFEDFYSKELKNKTEKEIYDLYNETFPENTQEITF